MAIVEVKQLEKTFGDVKALEDVTFSVEAGEVAGFIGPNGAGKSTTIRILLGMIKASGGEARIFGKDVWKERQEIHKRVSYVPGDMALWNNLSGGEIIDLFMTFSRLVCIRFARFLRSTSGTGLNISVDISVVKPLFKKS